MHTTDNLKTEILRTPHTSGNGSFRPLTLFDRTGFRWVLRGTWIFRGQLNELTLKKGLVNLLSYYPHLTGRIEQGKNIILNNEGIPFVTVKEPTISIAEADAERKYIDRFTLALDHQRIKTGKSPLLGVKLTTISDGTVVGVSGAHAMLDGASFFRFVDNWARICRGESIEPPVFDQNCLPAATKLPRPELIKKILGYGGVKMTPKILFIALKALLFGNQLERSRGFYVSSDALQRLRNGISDAGGFVCSSNDALCAFVLQQCVRLNGHTGTQVRYATVNVVDCRKRISSVPGAFVGNMSYMVNTPALPAATPLADKARAIHNAIAPVVSIPSPVLEEMIALSFDGIIKKMQFLPYDITRSFHAKPTLIYVNNFSRLPIYDVDFGTGRPFSAIPHRLGDPVLIWPAHPDKGGVEIYFSGSLGHAVNRLKPTDQWLKEMQLE